MFCFLLLLTFCRLYPYLEEVFNCPLSDCFSCSHVRLICTSNVYLSLINRCDLFVLRPNLLFLWLSSSPSAFSIPFQNHFRKIAFFHSSNVSKPSQFSFNYFKNILIHFHYLSNSLVSNFIQS